MAPDTVLLPVFTRQTLAIINFICLSQSLPSSFLSLPLSFSPPFPFIPPQKNLQFGPFLLFRFRRQCKLLQPAAKNYQVRKLNEDEELENVSSWKNVDYQGRGPGGFPTIYPHILGCLSLPAPLHASPGALEKQLALSAAKRIYQSKWYCKPYGRHTLCEDLKDIRRMAQAGTQVCLVIAIVFECVRARACVCVFTCGSVCLWSFCLGRREKEHDAPKTPEQTDSWCAHKPVLKSHSSLY